MHERRERKKTAVMRQQSNVGGGVTSDDIELKELEPDEIDVVSGSGVRRVVGVGESDESPACT